MYIGFGLFRHDISGVRCTSVKVSGTRDRSKGAQVMWTGWTAGCVCLADIMFSGVPRKSYGRWVKAGSGDKCLYLYMCVWETERKADKTWKNDSTFLMHFLGLWLRQRQRDWTSHPDKCILFCLLRYYTNQNTETRSLREKEIDGEQALSLWSLFLSHKRTVSETPDVFLEIRDINSEIKHEPAEW